MRLFSLPIPIPFSYHSLFKPTYLHNDIELWRSSHGEGLLPPKPLPRWLPGGKSEYNFAKVWFLSKPMFSPRTFFIQMPFPPKMTEEFSTIDECEDQVELFGLEAELNRHGEWAVHLSKHESFGKSMRYLISVNNVCLLCGLEGIDTRRIPLSCR
ncbi:hypothetical protein ARMGADRAFT_102929 [Armillaria gallica]|uniref:Uncharacterized protein n=1 Tax=Armillaria gallica TaxID=47427 RepID=A0A2H3CWY3_ARMGA|nr:hypothetical protein ARMGADRAFT_102929 [Armillaria gallica]